MIRFVLSTLLLEVSPKTPPYPDNPQNMKFRIIMSSNTDFYRNRSISFVMIRFVLSPPLLEVSPKTPSYPHNPQNMKFHIIMNSNTDFYCNRSISFDMINFVQLETCPASLCGGSRLETVTYFSYFGVYFSSVQSWSYNQKFRAEHLPVVSLFSLPNASHKRN